MKRDRLAVSLLALLLVLGPCGSVLGRKVETRMVWEAGGEYIRLFREVGSGGPYSQPAHFHEKDLNRILLSLHYSRYQFFHWSNATRVFDDAQARRLAPHFQRAFLEAGPEDVVEFYLPLQAKKLLGLSGQTFLTRGRAFVKGDRLHVRFDNVQQRIQSYATHAEDQKSLPPSAWKLVPQEGQAYGGEPSPSDPEGAEPHELVIDLGRTEVPAAPPRAENPAPASAAPPAQARHPDPVAAGVAVPSRQETGAPPPGPAADPRARERLRELQQMLQERLITEQDYNRKKQEILDAF